MRTIQLSMRKLTHIIFEPKIIWFNCPIAKKLKNEKKKEYNGGGKGN